MNIDGNYDWTILLMSVLVAQAKLIQSWNLISNF